MEKHCCSFRFAPISLFALLLIAACATLPATTPASTIPPTPTDIWTALLSRTPYPYATPLPPAIATAIDGTYVKDEEFIGERIHCRRCPDWGHEGGVWKLRFSKGIYIVLHTETNWRGLGSYTVAGDKIYLFNDSVCNDEVGVYQWNVEKGQLVFKEIGDACFVHLRAENLQWQPWLSCQPPNLEAAITDHWLKPKGCE